MLWFEHVTALTGLHPWSLPAVHFLILAVNGGLPYALSAVMFWPSAWSQAITDGASEATIPNKTLIY